MPSPLVPTDGQTSLRVPRVQVRPLLLLPSRACHLNSIVSDASIDLVAQSLGISRIEAADCICGHCETAAVALTGALRSSLTCSYLFSDNQKPDCDIVYRRGHEAAGCIHAVCLGSEERSLGAA